MGLFGKLFKKKDKKKGKGKAEAEKVEEKAAEPAPEPEPVKEEAKKERSASGELSSRPADAPAAEAEPAERPDGQEVAKVEVALDATGSPESPPKSPTGRLSSGSMPAIANSVMCAGCNRELPVPLVGHATTVICPFCTTPNEYNPNA